MLDVEHQHHHQEQHRVDKNKLHVRVVGQVEKFVEGHAAFFRASTKFQTEKGGGRGRHAVWSAGEGQPVVQYQANNLPEPEGDDGQIVTVHAQHRETEQGACGGGHDCRQRQHAPET